MILSNQIRPDGTQAGLNDAGQGWHTDMSYSRDIALTNMPHTRQVPVRRSRCVGETQFRNMHAAYDEPPEKLKHRLQRRTATRDCEKFWEVMRLCPRSRRARLMDEQKRRKPPVFQPLVHIHPLTGRHVLYVNPRYTRWIDDMDHAKSDTILRYLFRHRKRADFLYTHRWSVGDVLMWDNIAPLEPINATCPARSQVGRMWCVTRPVGRRRWQTREAVARLIREIDHGWRGSV